MNVKVCPICKIEKFHIEYHKSSLAKGGIQYRCKECNREKANINNKIRRSKQSAKDQYTEYNLKIRYGLTQKQYNLMNSAQNGKCEICKKEETATRNLKVKKLAVDHCHNTGKIRALLCTKCNTSLGVLGEQIDVLLSMIDYLKKYNN